MRLRIVFVVITLLCFCSNLQANELWTSYSARPAKIDGNPYDYEVEFGLKTNDTQIEIEKERQDGGHYFNQYYRTSFNVKRVDLIGEYKDTESRNLFSASAKALLVFNKQTKLGSALETYKRNLKNKTWMFCLEYTPQIKYTDLFFSYSRGKYTHRYTTQVELNVLNFDKFFIKPVYKYDEIQVDNKVTNDYQAKIVLSYKF